MFGGGAGHITADDWCVCERGVSENVMIDLGRVHFYRWPTRGRVVRVFTQKHMNSCTMHTPTTSPGVSAMASPTLSKVAFANWKYKHYFSLVEGKFWLYLHVNVEKK